MDRFEMVVTIAAVVVLAAIVFALVWLNQVLRRIEQRMQDLAALKARSGKDHRPVAEPNLSECAKDSVQGPCHGEVDRRVDYRDSTGSPPSP